MRPPICETPGCDNNCVLTGRKSDGSPRYKKKCIRCHRTRYGTHKKDRGGKKIKFGKNAMDLKLKLLPCAGLPEHGVECYFVPQDVCQMDVDHIDGNRENDDPSNLRLICACCHRLKTKLCKDHVRPQYQTT